MIKKSYLLTIYLMLLVFAAGTAFSAETGKPPDRDSSFCNDVDKSIKPGDDFYQFANGAWLKAHPIPKEKAQYGAFDEVYDRTYLQMKEIAEEAAAAMNSPEGSPERKLGDFYRAAMDTGNIEKTGISPLKPLFARIDNLRSVKDMQILVAYFQTRGIEPLFSIYSLPDPRNSSIYMVRLEQGGLSLPDRDYYVKTDKVSVELRADYERHIANMFRLLGEDQGKADAMAARVLHVETMLAKASYTNVENRDPLKTNNCMATEKLQSIMPHFDWKAWFDALGHPGVTEINVGQVEFFAKLDGMMTEIPLEDWRIFLRWKLISEMAEYVSSPFEKEDFSFFGKRLDGKPEMAPRWKRVLKSVNFKLGQLLGRVYVKKYFPPEAKARMLLLVSNLRKSFHLIISDVAWMTPGTKKEAEKKLEAMGVKVGYPDKWEDYSPLEIKHDSYVENMLRVNNFFFRWGPVGLEYAGHPVDKSRWEIPPQLVNAMYDPTKNEIVFPAAILQPPFFGLKQDDAENYGAIGTVIGHEMTHGFDDQGRHYDKDGNLRDWWTAQDGAEFGKRAELLVEQFNKYEALPGLFINGKLTLGENIADLGGLNIAYGAYALALEQGDGKGADECFNDMQRFFLSYARIWRQNIRDELLRKQVLTDPHSPDRYRVNGALFDFQGFYDAFPDISPSDRLYRPVKSRPVIWGVERREF